MGIWNLETAHFYELKALLPLMFKPPAEANYLSVLQEGSATADTDETPFVKSRSCTDVVCMLVFLIFFIPLVSKNLLTFCNKFYCKS
jgi:hypothetical protein